MHLSVIHGGSLELSLSAKLKNSSSNSLLPQLYVEALVTVPTLLENTKVIPYTKPVETRTFIPTIKVHNS
jgi:hypothetical protein